MKPLIFPTVNMNGTSKIRLLHQQIGVIDAFRMLREAMRDAWPHGRDFQTVADGTGGLLTCAQASEAMMERVEILQAMQHEFQQMAEFISTGKMPELPTDDCEIPGLSVEQPPQ